MLARIAGFLLFIFCLGLPAAIITLGQATSVISSAAFTYPENLSGAEAEEEIAEIDAEPNGQKQTTLLPANRDRDLRKFPYPYGAMFAFASDIDDTTPREFAMYHRFLNTKEMTPAGPGLGLDVGDTMWVYMGNNVYPKVDYKGESVEAVMTFNRYLDPKSFKNAKLLKHYFDAGWVDGLHSFGDFIRKDPKDVVFSRELAVAAWENLNQAGIHPVYWINHGNEANKQNFGGYHPLKFTRYQAGDDPKSPYYHTDITIRNGVRFVWNSVGEDQFGQDSPIFPIQLRDGQKIWGFHRYTHEVVNGKIDWAWSADDGDFYRFLTKERLEQLIANKQYCIFAQHFGGSTSEFPFIFAKDVEALRTLADYHHSGKILVARTSRLLNYSVAQQFVHYVTAQRNGRTVIAIKSIQDPLFGKQEVTIDKVRGLTFYVDDPQNAKIVINRRAVPKEEIQINPPDETGRPSIGIKWFAQDSKDYSLNAPAE
ncbi:hypothetical protein [Effusibacillus consociatus]|uniref:Uncharacterized protein n=1 Tax=Effusibacillus consociatus TaxID=1117041 RepID=A0ABV9Q1E0_9BACL